MAVLKELILIVSTFGGCGGVDRTDFNSLKFQRVWWSVERTDFNRFYFERVWQF